MISKDKDLENQSRIDKKIKSNREKLEKIKKQIVKAELTTLKTIRELPFFKGKKDDEILAEIKVKFSTKTLLVIVDLQKGFLNETTEHIVDKIKELVKTKQFSHIVASQFINTEGSPFQRLMSWFDLQKAEEIALDPLVLDVAEKIFQKDTYSCWTCEFEKYVKENEIDEIYFCGVDTDACVLKSAVDTFERNIDVKVIADCCASTGGIDSHRAGLLVLQRLISKKSIL